jgi:hypothetical protein
MNAEHKPRVNLKSMEIAQIIALLVAERDRLNKAIEALQGPTKRRGRPNNPLAGTAPTVAPAPNKKRRKFSAAQREAAAERMRQRWAAKKKAAAKPTRKAVSKPQKTAK